MPQAEALNSIKAFAGASRGGGESWLPKRQVQWLPPLEAPANAGIMYPIWQINGVSI